MTKPTLTHRKNPGTIRWGHKLCAPCKGNGYLTHQVGQQLAPQCQKCEGYGDVPDLRYNRGACRTRKQIQAQKRRTG